MFQFLLLFYIFTASLTRQSSSNLIFSYYYGSTQGLKPWEQPGTLLSHVLFSFANILVDGTVTLHGPTHTTSGTGAWIKATEQTMGHMDVGDCACSPCLKGELYQMHLLKRKYPHLKTILSIGGWTWSDNFSVAFASQTGRKRAIDSAQLLMQEFGFDGLDIEYKFWQSSPSDWDNLSLFLSEARDTYKDKYLLTAATPGYIFSGSIKTWTKIGQVLDYVLVMGYEYQHGQERTWGGSTFKAALGDTDVEKSNTVIQGLKTYLDKGVPSSKIVLGMPMYATGYKGFTDQVGLGMFTAGLSMLEPMAYNVLVNDALKYTQQDDTDRGVSVWTNKTHMWLSESPRTVSMKAEYVKTNKYAGIMFWNYAQDTLDTKTSLGIAASLVLQIDTVGGRSSPWCVDETQWCNLKCSFVSKLKTTVSGGTSISVSYLSAVACIILLFLI